jgi:para-nitrobenzyl esterase
MSWKDYFALTSRASAKLRAEGAGGAGMMAGFSPVEDGIYLPQGPLYTGDLSSDIPMIISSTYYERSPTKFDSTLEEITLDGVKEQLQRSFGDKTGEVVDAYARVYPTRKPVEIWGMLNNNYRPQAVAACIAKSKQSAPAYNAWFGWNPPMFDGRLRAFHTMDIAFWFYNTDVQASHTGGKRPRDLSAKMAATLVNFMKTGDPNGGGLPQWPRYTEANGEVMLLDDVSEVQNDPDREARKYWPA